MYSKIVAFSLSVLLIAACFPSKKVDSVSNPIGHELFTDVLQNYVSDNGGVNYKSLQSNRSSLDDYLALLSTNHPNDKNWKREEQLAYWINAYNAFTLDLVLRHYPVESIKDIAGGLGIPFINSSWDIKFIEIEGHRYDLNQIEHNILRKHFDEPRIHFAINCASISCPKLLNRAFEPETLEEQLHSVATEFINDTTRNNIKTERASLSKIFLWFKGDFTKKMDLKSYVNQYSAVKMDKKAKVKWMEYDWGLNTSLESY